MGKDDPQVTAAACRYILVGLLRRLEQVRPGLLAELQSGIASDRQAMAASGKLSPSTEAVVSEAQRILSLGSAP
jgi:hypothetical protein